MMSTTLAVAAASVSASALDSEPDTGVAVDFKPGDPVKPRVYRKRWLMLALFCGMSMSSAFQWIQYSIITSAVVHYYGVDNIAVDWTSMIYMLGYIPFVFPATWLLDKYGLRLSALLGSFGTCLGAWVKCASASPERFAVTFLGQAIVGFSQIFILGIPPRLAAVWFGPNEVSTATSLGVFGNQVGIAIGFYVPTAIVRNASDSEQIGHDLQALFFGTAAVTSLVFILIFFVFSDAPPVPPSQAQVAAIASSIERNYMQSLWRLVSNKNYMLLVITYGVNVGVFYGVSTLLSQTLGPIFPDSDDFFGIIGFAIVIAGMFGAIAGGYILDKTHRFKLTTIIVYVCSVAGMLAYSLTIYLYNLWIVFATAIFLGFFMTGYLSVGFEFGAELTYPCSEGTQSGILNASAQVFGIVLILGMGAVLRASGPMAANITMTVVLAIGTILTVFIKSDLRRQKANAATGTIIPRDESSGLILDSAAAERSSFIPNSQTELTFVSVNDDSNSSSSRHSPKRRPETRDAAAIYSNSNNAQRNGSSNLSKY